MTIRDKVYILPEDTTGTGAYRLIWPALYLQKARPDLAHLILVVPRKNRGQVLNGKIEKQKFGGGVSGDLPPLQVGTDQNGDVRAVFPPDDMGTIVLQRVTHRYLVQSIPFWKEMGIRVVVDIDDDLSEVHPGNQAAAGLRPRPGHINAAHHLIEACRLADVVTCTTSALAARYRSDAVILPNYLPDGAFVDGHDDANTSLMWPAGMHSHPNDLDALKGVLPWVVRQTGALVQMVGQDAQDLDRYTRLTGVEAQRVDPVGMPEWPRFLSRVGVGMIPLADTAFNAAKCLDYDTRVATRRGILPAGEIEVGDHVWSSGKWRLVEATSQGEPSLGVEITTKYGWKIRSTPNHRFWASGGWVHAEDLTAGSLIALTPDCNEEGPYIRKPWPADGRWSASYVQDRDGFKSSSEGPKVDITETWGRLIGLYLGDGNLYKTRFRIACDGQDSDLMDLIEFDLGSIGLTCARLVDKRSPRRCSVHASSVHLVRFMESLGLWDGTKVARIPDVIWRSPRRVQSAFLAGLFEADGTCGDTKPTPVSLSNTKVELLRDTQRLLATFGIQSYLKYRPVKYKGLYRDAWALHLLSVGTSIFAKEVGFLSNRKNNRLASVVARIQHPGQPNRKQQTWADEIESVAPCTVTPVDLQVSGSVFAAAGFVSHNSKLKGIELAAAGVPFVASPRADYLQMQRESGLGILAATRNEWRRELKHLITDDAWRKHISDLNRATAQKYRLREHATRWAAPWGLA